MLVTTALLVGCGGSTPKADDADDDTWSAAPSEPAPKWNEPAPDEPPPAEEQASSSGGDDEVKLLPESYDISIGDCRLLARTYGAATRSDEGAKLSPKLKEEKREKAKAAIAKAADKLEQRWFDSCAESLVGMTRDRESLNCAIKAKTVKEFDVCLNGEGE